MARPSVTPGAWDEAARALVPGGLLIAAALIHELRPFILAGLVGGTIIAIGRAAPVRWAWAATVPVAVSLTFGLLPVPTEGSEVIVCASPTSPLALWRAGEALLVLGTAAVLGTALRATRSMIWLTVPRSSVARLAGVAGVVSAIGGLIIGTVVAAPFFGTISLDLGQPLAIVPALVFATANGLMEEIAYRGVLMGWLAKVGGLVPALLLQAVVFGVAHASGADVGGSPVVFGLALGAGGLIAGVITIRTRSLAIPIAIHIGLDVALYYGLACRIG